MEIVIDVVEGTGEYADDGKLFQYNGDTFNIIEATNRILYKSTVYVIRNGKELDRSDGMRTFGWLDDAGWTGFRNLASEVQIAPFGGNDCSVFYPNFFKVGDKIRIESEVELDKKDIGEIVHRTSVIFNFKQKN